MWKLHGQMEKQDAIKMFCGDGAVVLVQNLQKSDGLGTQLMTERPFVDVFLAQEVSLFSEKIQFENFVSKRGYGTAIHSKHPLSNVRKVESPHAEFGGFIVKKTTVAEVTVLGRSIDVVSFHGYNGWPVFRDASYLVDHVRAVLKVLRPADVPVLFCGDFNTWTEEHVSSVEALMQEYGLTKLSSWSYPGRDVPLDHAFGRGFSLVDMKVFESQADHRGALIQVKLLL